MQRQKEAVALATAQNRILQQQCKFYQFWIKNSNLTKIHFFGQNSEFSLIWTKILGSTKDISATVIL